MIASRSRTRSRPALLRRLDEAVVALGLHGASVAVAVSGGVDSTVLASALVVGPVLLRVLRRLDLRIAPEARALRMDGELGGSWR